MGRLKKKESVLIITVISDGRTMPLELHNNGKMLIMTMMLMVLIWRSVIF